VDVRSSGTVRRLAPGPPLVLEVEVPDASLHQLELAHNAPLDVLRSLEQELLGQSVEFMIDGDQTTVFFYRPVTEDGEVEYVYKVCLNAELARLARAGG